MSFLDKLFQGAGAPAHALATPTGSIAVDGNEPTPGYFLKVIDPTHARWMPGPEGGAGGSALFASHVAVDGTVMLEANGVYVVGANVTLQIPDGTLPANAGCRVWLDLQGDDVTLELTAGVGSEFPSNILVDGASYQYEPVVLPRGRYQLYCVYDALVYPVAFWVLTRSADAWTRRSVDVNYCMPGLLPPGYTFQAIGTTGYRFTITADPDAVIDLPVDNDVSIGFNDRYPAGATVLVPFDTLTAGLFQVVRHNGPGDWALELLERVYPLQLFGPSMTEYRIVNGTLFRGRVLRPPVLGSGLTQPPARYEMDPCALRAYPQPADWTGADDALTGDPARMENGYEARDLLVGRVNRVQASSTGTRYFRVRGPSPDVADRWNGERFAILAMGSQSANSGVIQIDPGPSSAIGIPPHGEITSGSFFVNAASYYEWVWDAWTKTWRLCSAVAGPPA